MTENEIVCECGNSVHFILDYQTMEITCACCGIIVSEEIFRENHFERHYY